MAERSLHRQRQLLRAAAADPDNDTFEQEQLRLSVSGRPAVRVVRADSTSRHAEQAPETAAASTAGSQAPRDRVQLGALPAAPPSLGLDGSKRVRGKPSKFKQRVAAQRAAQKREQDDPVQRLEEHERRTHVPRVLAGIRERGVDEHVVVRAPDPNAAGFRLSAETGFPAAMSREAFARRLEEKRGGVRRVDGEEKRVRGGGRQKRSFLSDATESGLISQEDSAKIDSDNVQLLHAMGAAEIEEMRQQLLSTLDPAVVAMLQQRQQDRDQARAEAQPAPSAPTAASSAALTTQSLDQRPARVVENHQLFKPKEEEDAHPGFYPNSYLDALDKEVEAVVQHPEATEEHVESMLAEQRKLEWMRPIEDDVDEDEAQLRDELPAGAWLFTGFNHWRVDFDGLPARADLPVHMGLHHHGDKPAVAGYTMLELCRLVRSTVPAQRIVALQTLAKVLKRARTGGYTQGYSLLHATATSSKDPTPLHAHEFSGILVDHLMGIDVVVLLRLALDEERNQTALAAAVDALHAFVVVCDPLGEQLLDLYQGLFATSQAPAALPEDEAAHPDDHAELAKSDTLTALVKMDVLVRLNYLLCTAGSLPRQSQCRALEIITAVAQHSRALSQDVVASPGLVDTLRGLVSRCVRSPEAADGDVLVATLRGITALCMAGRATAVEVVFSPDASEVRDSLCSLVVSATSPDTYILPECTNAALRLWRVLFTYGIGTTSVFTMYRSLTAMMSTPMHLSAAPGAPFTNAALVYRALTPLMLEPWPMNEQVVTADEDGIPTTAEFAWANLAPSIGHAMRLMRELLGDADGEATPAELQRLGALLHFVSAYFASVPQKREVFNPTQAATTAAQVCEVLEQAAGAGPLHACLELLAGDGEGGPARLFLPHGSGFAPQLAFADGGDEGWLWYVSMDVLHGYAELAASLLAMVRMEDVRAADEGLCARLESVVRLDALTKAAEMVLFHHQETSPAVPLHRVGTRFVDRVLALHAALPRDDELARRAVSCATQLVAVCGDGDEDVVVRSLRDVVFAEGFDPDQRLAACRGGALSLYQASLLGRDKARVEHARVLALERGTDGPPPSLLWEVKRTRRKEKKQRRKRTAPVHTPAMDTDSKLYAWPVLPLRRGGVALLGSNQDVRLVARRCELVVRLSTALYDMGLVEDAHVLRGAMEVQNMGAPVFGQPQVAAALRECLEHVMPSASTGVDFDAAHVRRVWGAHYPFFKDLLECFAEQSMGDESFAQCVLLHTGPSHAVEYRRLAWEAVAPIVQAARIPTGADAKSLHVEDFVEQPEQDKRILKLLAGLLVGRPSGVRLSHAANPFVYEVVVRHVGACVFDETRPAFARQVLGDLVEFGGEEAVRAVSGGVDVERVREALREVGKARTDAQPAVEQVLAKLQ